MRQTYQELEELLNETEVNSYNLVLQIYTIYTNDYTYTYRKSYNSQYHCGNNPLSCNTLQQRYSYCMESKVIV